MYDLKPKSLHITPVKPRKLEKEIINQIKESKQTQKNIQVQQQNLLIHKMAIKTQQKARSSLTRKEKEKDKHFQQRQAAPSPSPQIPSDFSKENLSKLECILNIRSK
jgi:hypothetical protein